MQIEPEEAGELIDIAVREIEASVAGKVLVIEDEAIIAMDIAAIVEQMGHSVTGIASHPDRGGAARLREPPRPDPRRYPARR